MEQQAVKYKIGDVVIVSNPDIDYERYRDYVGKIITIPDGTGVIRYYHVQFSDRESDRNAFRPEELTPAKNHQVLLIINNL